MLSCYSTDLPKALCFSLTVSQKNTELLHYCTCNSFPLTTVSEIPSRDDQHDNSQGMSLTYPILASEKWSSMVSWHMGFTLERYKGIPKSCLKLYHDVQSIFHLSSGQNFTTTGDQLSKHVVAYLHYKRSANQGNQHLQLQLMNSTYVMCCTSCNLWNSSIDGPLCPPPLLPNLCPHGSRALPTKSARAHLTFPCSLPPFFNPFFPK